MEISKWISDIDTVKLVKLTLIILGSKLPVPSLAPVPGVAKLHEPAVTQKQTPTVLLFTMNPFCGPARASADFLGVFRATSPDDDDDDDVK